MATVEGDLFDAESNSNRLQPTGSEDRLWQLEQFWPRFKLDFFQLEQWTRWLEGQRRAVQGKDDSNLELSPDAISGLQGSMEGIIKLEFLGFVLAKEPTGRGPSGVGGRRRRLCWALARWR